MVILMILFGVFFAAGLFLILAEVFRIPTMQTVKVMSAAGRSEKKAAKTVDMWIIWTKIMNLKIHREIIFQN